MALPNPWYIDQNARHDPGSIRLLSYGLTSGVQGVLGNSDLAVKQTGTPSAKVQVMPGGYNVLSRHLGGAYESYAGKFDVAEDSPTISPTGSTGRRRDLVILQIQNPYVSGTGSWTIPADAALGPYAKIVVVENVGSTVWDVSQWNNTWEAITLAVIDRPASKGVVDQTDIIDVRSLAALGGTRTVVEQVQLPPIAQAYYMQFKDSPVDPNYGKITGGSDSEATNDRLVADGTTKNWPASAVWQNIAVPDWAVECDAEMVIYNVQVQLDDCYGKLWLDFGGTPLPFQTYAIDFTGQPGRHNIGFGKTFTIPSNLRGKLITVRSQAASYYVTPGRLSAKSGTTTKLALNFQRKPDPS